MELAAHPRSLTEDLSSQEGEVTTASLGTGPGNPRLKSHWLRGWLAIQLKPVKISQA